LYDRQRLLQTYPVGIGTRDTPTPGGLYYLIELLRPPNPSGAYGPYAYGLSGFSDVIHHFNGGDGVIGLHGTNEPQKVGHDVSHGCIRMRNADITRLAHLLPLGTPIRIVA
jgi:lipoprotein-anchoring transpeptidase ErfK/SrfK